MLALSATLISLVLAAPAHADLLPPLPPLSPIAQLGWEPDGPVSAVATSGNLAFIGGGFTHVGPPATANGAVVSATTAVPRYGLPRVVGDVLAVTGDGGGGWFVGGRFTKVGGVSCARLAHVRADLTVDPAFCPRPSQLTTEELGSPNNGPAEVRVLLRSGDVLFVGGTFRTIGFDAAAGAPVRRTHLAALSATDGRVLPWNPGPIRRDDGMIASGSGPASDGISTAVHTLAISGTSLYVGGAFSSVQGSARKSLAALSTGDASLLGFAPRATRAPSAGELESGVEPRSSQVRALAVGGDFLFAGGDFASINGVARGGLAKLDRTTGALVTAWNAQAQGGRVEVLRASGANLYVGGTFSGIRRSGPPTNNTDLTTSGPNAGAVLRTTGAVRTWVSGTDGPVHALALNGSDVILSGAFQAVSGQARPGAAMVSSAGAVRPWNPRAAFTCASGFECPGVSAVFTSAGDVYLGGAFRYVGGADRAGLAAIDLTSGEATPWDPRLPGGSRVDSLVVRGGTLYAAGAFTSAGGLPRAGLAGLSTATAAVTVWQSAPLPVAPPPGLFSGPAGIYLLGRDAGTGAGQPVPAVATDPATGAAGAWAPNVAGLAFIVPSERGIRVAAALGDTLYLGGSFATVGGQARPQLGAV